MKARELILYALKCLYGQQGFCGFGISVTSKNIFKPKQLNSNAFFPRNQALNFPLRPRPMSLFAFCQRERLTTTKTTVSWASKIWQFLTWRHDPFKNPGSYFALTHGQLHWAWVKWELYSWFLGHKMSERVFFLEYLLHVLEIPKQQNPCWLYRHFKNLIYCADLWLSKL